MAQTQIFISHSSSDKTFTDKLYDALLADGYWVWMDKSLQPAEKWEPQIDENLRRSKIFLVLLSSASVKSDWVKHEGSMAFALNQQIIPVKIDQSCIDLERNLPIWAKPIQLHKLFDGSAGYEDQYQELKQLLGEPLPIRQHLEEMLFHYQKSGMLLDEVALALIDRHYHELSLPKDKKVIADRLIEESRRKLESYWTKYDKLLEDYKNAKREIDKLSEMNKSGILESQFLSILLFVLLGASVFYLAVTIISTYFPW